MSFLADNGAPNAMTRSEVDLPLSAGIPLIALVVAVHPVHVVVVADFRE
jgi:hypothetical protein